VTNEKTIRKWIAKYQLEEPLLYHRFEQKEKYDVIVTRKTTNGNGGLFIKSHSKVFRNTIINVELVPKSKLDKNVFRFGIGRQNNINSGHLFSFFV